MSLKYWEQHHFEKLENATTYSELFIIAHSVLKRMPAPVGQVCGPISTGGAGSVDGNLALLEKAITDLQEKNIEIFDQIIFEKSIQRIKGIREKRDEYDNSLLVDFYLPIFESKLVHRLFFLPDWQSSIGAAWEHEQAQRIGMKIIYL